MVLCADAGSTTAAAPPVKAVLNGLQLEIDADTGGLLRLAYPGVGDLLQATPERSGIIDLAYPVKEFEVQIGRAHV